MKAQLNKKTSEYEVIISPQADTWKKEVEKSRAKLTKDLSIKGFRKGKVPADIAKKHILDSEVYTKAMWELLGPLSKEAAKEVPKEIMILDAPTYHPLRINGDQLEIKFLYPIYPDIKLGEYKNINLKYEQKKPTQETIDNEIQRIVKTQSMLKPKQGKVAKGDVVEFDFEGMVDGKPFQGGSAKNHQLEIGSGKFIPGFEDQMIGMNKGDENDINVTFPKDYPANDLKGKSAVFKVKIHDIKTKEAASLNDEFVKSLKIKDVANIEELKAYIEKVFTEQERQKSRRDFQQKAFEIILKNSEFVIPKSLIMRETRELRKQFEEQLKQQGMDIKNYMNMTKMSPEKLDEQFTKQAEQRMKDSLIFAEIARREKIKLEESDYEKEYAKLAKVYNQTVDGIKGTISKEKMQIPMTNDRVIDVIIKNVKK